MSDYLKEQIHQSITSTPIVEGPISVTENSHPFCSSQHTREPLDLNEWGYTEEEYFLSGHANVYEEAGDSMKVKHTALPYKNRIMVRKPEESNHFSGRVYIDIYNASNGYDIEDIWRRSSQYFLENGHVYIGVTSKPINVLSLKNFDYERYHSLNWTGAEPAVQPATVDKNMSIPGTEEGLFWDILSQLAVLTRENKAAFLKGYAVDSLYLMGQSQSGMYLNTYITYFNPYLKNEKDKSLFDGYLNVVGAGVMRTLNQKEGEAFMFGARPSAISKVDVPFINVSAHGDINLFKTMPRMLEALEDSNTENHKIRHYEVASAPHTDPASPLIPDNEEIKKTKNPPKILDGEYSYTVNDLKLDYYVNSALELLHQWAVHDVEPPAGQSIEQDDAGNVIEDEFGNAKGGLRSPYVDVPIATYHANAKASEDELDQSVGNVNGSMDYFTKEKFLESYGTKENYLSQFNEAVDQQVEEGLLLLSDGNRMKDWAIQTVETIYNKE